MKSRRHIPPARVTEELLPGQSKDLLRELHLLTRHGQLNADARRKLKQVNHLINLLRPALDDVFARAADPVIVDVGCGKSYLGFLLHDLYLRGRAGGRIIGVEARPELVERAAALAARLGFARMQFIHTQAQAADLPPRIHLLTALHACDTATDEAIVLGLRGPADYIALVPCCQAEVAQRLKGAPDSPLRELYAHPLHRREFASHLTNVLRCLALEASGYQVTVTELVGWEHSLKNELILARRVGAPRSEAARRLRDLLAAFPVMPSLLREMPGPRPPAQVRGGGASPGVPPSPPAALASRTFRADAQVPDNPAA